MSAELETCQNCQRAIGQLEHVYLWNEHTVCAKCFGRLRGGATASRLPRLIVGLCFGSVVGLIIGGLLVWHYDPRGERGAAPTVGTTKVGDGASMARIESRPAPSITRSGIDLSVRPPAAVLPAVAPPSSTNFGIDLSVRHDFVESINNLGHADTRGAALDGIKSDAFLLRNNAVEPITVLNASFNGDYSPVIAELFDNNDQREHYYVPRKTGFPVTLTIGQSVALFHHSNMGWVGVGYGYEKDVLFIDVVTDKGTVRLKTSR
jgi:hypothetical protein